MIYLQGTAFTLAALKNSQSNVDQSQTELYTPKLKEFKSILIDDSLVELALLQFYGVIKTLPFNCYSSPIFAKWNPNGKLRILLDLRKINHLIGNDYNHNNFTIATLTDAGTHFVDDKLFCKKHGSHGYFSVSVADEQSVQLIAFNFATRTYAFQRLAQGLKEKNRRHL